MESGSGYNHSVGYTYNEENRLSSQVETIGTDKRTTSYQYDDDGRITVHSTTLSLSGFSGMLMGGYVCDAPCSPHLPPSAIAVPTEALPAMPPAKLNNPISTKNHAASQETTWFFVFKTLTHSK